MKSMISWFERPQGSPAEYFPAFEFQARPVVAVEDAVRVELEAMAWRDGLDDK